MKFDHVNLGQLMGAKIVAEDGQFLGEVTSAKDDPKSISNSFGDFGNVFKTNSIFNGLGKYGSRMSSLSPFNTLTPTPPKIIKDDRFVAFLTCNDYLSPRVDPNELMEWLGLSH